WFGESTAGAVTTAALVFHRLFNPSGALVGLFDQIQPAGAPLTRMVGGIDEAKAAPQRSTAPAPDRPSLVLEHLRCSDAAEPGARRPRTRTTRSSEASACASTPVSTSPSSAPRGPAKRPWPGSRRDCPHRDPATPRSPAGRPPRRGRWS